MKETGKMESEKALEFSITPTVQSTRAIGNKT